MTERAESLIANIANTTLIGLAIWLWLPALITGATIAANTTYDILTNHPAAACQMTFAEDACLDTSTIRDLR